MGFINTEAGSLIGPGGIEMHFGKEVELTANVLDNPAVAGWIASGRLVPAHLWAPAAPVTIAALEARVADLEAQLEAASAPAVKGK